MRALHLNFWLHHPYKLHEKSQWTKGYFGGEAEFARVDREEYQPLLALIERNSQRYPKLRLSLVISGMWLEQAERWDVELIRRIRKLVESKNVELVASPYYQAMAAFYNLEELKAQIELTQEKYEHFFGVKSEILALPELCFHSKMVRLVEETGFRAVIAGDARENLGWRSANYLYELKQSDGLRVMCQNRVLGEMIERANSGATVEVAEKVEIDLPDADLKMDEVSGVEAFARSMRSEGEISRERFEQIQTRKIFAAKKFQKELDLAFLRGNLVNLCLKSDIFEKWREAGVVGFFDELVKIWMETPGSKLVGPAEVLELKPEGEISLKRTVSRWGESTEKYALPGWWNKKQAELAARLYELREKVVAKGDKDLYRNYARLTALDYAEGGAEFEQIWESLRQEVASVAVPRDRSIVKGRDGLVESTAVKIKFDKEAREAKHKREQLLQMYREANASDDEDIIPHEDDIDDMAATIQVLAQRMKMENGDNARDLSELEEAEVVSGDIWMEGDDYAGETNVADDVLSEEPVEEEPRQKIKRKVKRKKIVID